MDPRHHVRLHSSPLPRVAGSDSLTLHTGNQDQVVPDSKGGDTRREQQRSLPTFSKEGTKVLDLFQGDDIFASREE